MATQIKTHMTLVPAKEAKNRFGELLDRAQHGPITIGKHGRPFAIVLAGVDYQNFMRFREMEDSVWGERALKAEREDAWLGQEKSAAFLKEMLNAKTRR
ncbi:MAG: type II toxin-antitoxin system prevent-host-death family antitoxin [bacterium]|nr:type II toxin-antitoxin system prevent-host-death family antitoxin [bacterium]